MGGGTQGSGTSASPNMSSMADYESQVAAQQKQNEIFGVIGKGISSAANNFELGGQTAPTISTNINYPSSSLQIPTGGSEGSGLIPATGQSDTAAVMEMLKRLLSQGGGGY